MIVSLKVLFIACGRKVVTMEHFDSNTPIQCPRTGMFSSNQLTWSTFDIAHIPWSRLSDFVDGEGRRESGRETSFYIRNSDHCPIPRSSWLVRLTYWCAFGPKHVPLSDVAVPPMRGTFPKEGPGSRPRACKHLFNNHLKQGCLCNFTVKRFKDSPEVCVIQYPQRCRYILVLCFFNLLKIRHFECAH
jgi:hypothetical protein